MIIHSLLTMGVPVLEKIIRTVAVYAGILVLFRVAGKRDLAQLNSFDLVVLLLLSNVVQNAIIGNDVSLSGGLVGAVVLIAVNGLVVRTAHLSARAEQVLEGKPTVLVEDGRVRRHDLRRLGVREAEILTAIRRQGANDLAEVKRATLMPGGSITVELAPEHELAKMRDIERLEAKMDRLLAASS